MIQTICIYHHLCSPLLYLPNVIQVTLHKECQMHTITSTSSASLLDAIPIIASKFVSLRLLSSVIGGAIVTFGLFVLMQALIANDNERPVVGKSIVITPFILEIPEEKIQKREPPQPIVEMKTPPPSLAKVDTQMPNTDGFNPEIKFEGLPTEPLIVNLQSADHQPRALVRVDPRYPARAASNGIEGFVTLSFGISASGEVVDIDVLESSPRNTFDNAAKQALRKWRYQPKMVSGSPVGMSGLQVRLDFTLNTN